MRGTSHGPVSVTDTGPWLAVCVCLSQVGVLLKRLNVWITKTTPHDSSGTPVFDAKDLREIRPGSPPTRAPNAGEVDQNRRRLLANNRLYLENGKR